MPISTTRKKRQSKPGATAEATQASTGYHNKVYTTKDDSVNRSGSAEIAANKDANGDSDSDGSVVTMKPEGTANELGGTNGSATVDTGSTSPTFSTDPTDEDEPVHGILVLAQPPFWPAEQPSLRIAIEVFAKLADTSLAGITDEDDSSSESSSAPSSSSSSVSESGWTPPTANRSNPTTKTSKTIMKWARNVAAAANSPIANMAASEFATGLEAGDKGEQWKLILNHVLELYLPAAFPENVYNLVSVLPKDRYSLALRFRLDGGDWLEVWSQVDLTSLASVPATVPITPSGHTIASAAIIPAPTRAATAAGTAAVSGASGKADNKPRSRDGDQVDDGDTGVHLHIRFRVHSSEKSCNEGRDANELVECESFLMPESGHQGEGSRVMWCQLVL